MKPFRAARLRQWGLPYKNYSDLGAVAVRATILTGVRERIRVSAQHAQLMLGSADALDAVIASFAAVAIAKTPLPGTEEFPTRMALLQWPTIPAWSIVLARRSDEPRGTIPPFCLSRSVGGLRCR